MDRGDFPNRVEQLVDVGLSYQQFGDLLGTQMAHSADDHNTVVGMTDVPSQLG